MPCWTIDATIRGELAMRFAEVGEVFSRQVTLTAEAIADFAHSCGDDNPLHRDTAFAVATRFGGVIACGPHYASLFMGLAATHFSQRGYMLGLEFSFRFRAAVKPDVAYILTWCVREVIWKESLRGEIVSLEGVIADASATPVLSSEGTVLVTARL
jgi:acyl dehydratase